MRGIGKMRWVLMGASSGLGRAFLEILSHQETVEILSLSRRAQAGFQVEARSFDFAKIENWGPILDEIEKFQPERIVYFAGGGPHGRYDQKKFSDHQWAFKVSFEFPAYLLHRILENANRSESSVKKICFIGSSIAESSADPLAASYAASKHALKGLIDSIKIELAESPSSIEISLFSPGYMNTRMLPAGSWPRQNPELVKEPEEIATELYAFLNQ